MNLSEDSHKYIKCVRRRQTVAVRRWFVCRNGRSFWRASFRNKNSSYTDYNCWTNLATRTKPYLTRARTLSTQVRATASRLKKHIWKLSSKYFVSGLILEKQEPNNVGNSECAFVCVCVRLLPALQFWLQIQWPLQDQTPRQPLSSQSLLWYECWRWLDRHSEPIQWNREV